MTLRRIPFIASFFISALLALAAVSASPPKPPGEGPLKPSPKPQNKGAVVHLSGAWSDADGERAAKALAAQLGQNRWIGRFAKAQRRPARLSLERVNNRSDQALNTRALRRQLGKALRPLARRLRLLSVKGRKRRAPDVELTLWLFSNRDMRGGTTVTATLVSLEGLLPSGEQVVAALYEQRKRVERPPFKTKPGPRRPKVSYLPLDKPYDLSGYLNDFDARFLSQRALNELLNKSWLSTLKSPPLLRIEGLRNRTSEHLQLALLRHRLASGLLRSGKARLVSATKGRADVTINGFLAGSVSRAGANQVRFYMLTLRGSERSGIMRWVHTDRIKKIVAGPAKKAPSKTAPSKAPTGARRP